MIVAQKFIIYLTHQLHSSCNTPSPGPPPGFFFSSRQINPSQSYSLFTFLSVLFYFNGNPVVLYNQQAAGKKRNENKTSDYLYEQNPYVT